MFSQAGQRRFGSVAIGFLWPVTRWAALLGLFLAVGGRAAAQVWSDDQAVEKILASVRDGTRFIDEAGLYVLLHRVSLQPVGAEAVRWTELTEDPGFYRGKWVKLAGRFAESSVGLLANKERWDKPVFVSSVLDEASKKAVSFVGTEGSVFRRNDPVWVEGFFFKLRVDVSQAGSASAPAEELIIPVIVGRCLGARNAWGGRSGGFQLLYVSVGAVVGLVVAYLYVRTRSRRAGPAVGRRPGRWVEEEVDPVMNEPIDLDDFGIGDGDPEGSEGESGCD